MIEVLDEDVAPSLVHERKRIRIEAESRDRAARATMCRPAFRLSHRSGPSTNRQHDAPVRRVAAQMIEPAQRSHGRATFASNRVMSRTRGGARGRSRGGTCACASRARRHDQRDDARQHALQRAEDRAGVFGAGKAAANDRRRSPHPAMSIDGIRPATARRSGRSRRRRRRRARATCGRARLGGRRRNRGSGRPSRRAPGDRSATEVAAVAQARARTARSDQPLQSQQQLDRRREHRRGASMHER